MARIEWQPSLAIGIQSIDEQHKDLLQTFNALIDKQEHSGLSCPAEDLVARLKTFAAEHFHIEEGYMQAFSYPDLPAHMTEHEAFLGTVATFENACAAGSATAEAILKFLEEWISGHLAGADRQMGRYLEDYLR
ncbi:bacteriohemerythrin [Humidesulfovibrio idahonensis]